MPTILDDYYVDPDGGNDSWNGDQFLPATPPAGPKLTIAAVLDLLYAAGILIKKVTIHLKHTATLYSGDIKFYSLLMFGEDGQVVIQPEVWNEDNYQSANGDPFNASLGAGQFNAQGDKNVTIGSLVDIRNTSGLEFRGIQFQNDDMGGIQADARGGFLAKYCRFSDHGSGVSAQNFSKAAVENCYFEYNQLSIYAKNHSHVTLIGNNFINDAYFNAIRAYLHSTVEINGWMNPGYFTTVIKNSQLVGKDYATIRAMIGSVICISNLQELDPLSPIPAHVVIFNNHYILKQDTVGVRLESGSILTGAGNMAFVTLDAKGEAKEWPLGQRIVQVGGDSRATS